MKTTRYFIFILLTFLMFAFVPNSFAQEGISPERMVRVVYLLPNDRQSQPDIDEKLDALIKEAQQFYADEMERHGFGRKTFQMETDENGAAIVHHVKGKYGEAHYRDNAVQSVLEETEDQFDESKNIYFYAVEVSSDFFDLNDGEGTVCGYGWGGTGGGLAIVPASGPCFVGNFGFTVAAHELGHAFGLFHDFHNDTYIMSYGEFRSKLSPCHAEWLDTHRYFNAAETSTHNTETMIEMLPLEISPPYAIRLRFQINDPDGLHQAQLLTPATEINEGRGQLKLLDCKSLSGNSNTVEFITTELTLALSEKDKPTILLNVMDVYGDFRGKWIVTDIALQFPQDEVVSIPDANLAAAVRKSLGLAPNSTIRQLSLLRLTRFFTSSEHKITDITGLEHAKHLKHLYLSNNQITDITPLTELTQLTRLELSGNQITDITPLTELTQLTRLELSGNQITDITPLTELTQLTGLGLHGNQITNITPLTGLTQLRDLNLDKNQVRDITPLKGLTQLRDLNLGRNQIRDITPLTTLTQLEFLALGHNQISDIKPFAELVNLQQVWLNDNQISDVKPLAELVNLQQVSLQDNPVNDREPLFALLRKNPDVEIYLKSGKPLPVTLSHFRAEHTEAGVVLKWITESEVDNAGFYIYRSQTKDGEFKVVNATLIQGAGTTSERHTYTWKDTTAKPNVAYYYRIEDISRAGVRKQLATVRMRGLVSARGKLTTMWANLKVQN